MTAAALLELASAKAWPKVQLGDVLEVQNGFAFSSKKFSEKGGVPLIRIRDLKDNGASAVGFLGDYDAAYVVNDGDLLIGMDGEFRCYEWRGGPALLNQRVCRLVNFDGQLHPRFLFHGINKHLKEIEDETSFTTVKHLSSKTVKAIEFPLPPLEEQKRIVAVLDQAFAALDRARVLAEANLADAEELFSSEIAGVISSPPQDWRRVKLGELVDLISGQHIDAKDYNTAGRGIGYLTGPSDFGPHFPVVSKWTEHPKRTAKGGDILITVKGSGVGSINMMGDDELAISRQLMAIRAKPNERDFIYFILEGSFAVFQNLANGSAIPGISRADVLDLELALPPASQLQAVVLKLQEIKEKSRKLSDLYARTVGDLDNLRQSLLQKAFAGELT